MTTPCESCKKKRYCVVACENVDNRLSDMEVNMHLEPWEDNDEILNPQGFDVKLIVGIAACVIICVIATIACYQFSESKLLPDINSESHRLSKVCNSCHGGKS